LKFNQKLIEEAIKPDDEVILAVDCSFISKSGKKTYGLDYFYNASVSKSEKGLEISTMAVVDVKQKLGYSLSVQQTPANSSSIDKTEQPETTRINHYLTQLEATVPYLPPSLRYVVSDGFYSKVKWVEGVTNLKLVNSSLSALNLAKWDAIGRHNSDTDFVFSMAFYKRRALNYHLLERFIDKLDLEPTLIKSHPNYSNLCADRNYCCLILSEPLLEITFDFAAFRLRLDLQSLKH
jgi:DDE superfamily endonuclease